MKKDMVCQLNITKLNITIQYGVSAIIADDKKMSLSSTAYRTFFLLHCRPPERKFRLRTKRTAP